MRKILILLLVTFMILSVAACGSDTVNDYSTIPPLPEVPEIPEVPPLPEPEVTPSHDAQDVDTQASTSESNVGETFSEPTFEYTVTWYDREISVGMKLFEVIDLGFEYGLADHRGVNGVDAETAQEIATRILEPFDESVFITRSYFILYGNSVLQVRAANFSEESISIMESHIVEIRTGYLGFPMGYLYYDGLPINHNTSFADVQSRFGDDGSAIENFLRYDYESGRIRGERFVNFHFDANTNNLELFIIINSLNPNLSDAVWDGELRFPRRH